VGKKRLRVEALLAAAASPLPPPAHDLIPDPTLADDLFPADLPHLLGLLGRADLYLQDEVEVALHPTLTRVWSRAGRAGQHLVQAPGKNFKQYGFGLVDWRDGHLDWAVADGRRAVPFCDQLRRAVARSRARGRIAMVILDNLGIHTPKGSRLLRGLLQELGEDLALVYTPTYDPEANRIEWLWRALRRTVTPYPPASDPRRADRRRRPVGTHDHPSPGPVPDRQPVHAGPAPACRRGTQPCGMNSQEAFS
jgi:hypothetical protein